MPDTGPGKITVTKAGPLKFPPGKVVPGVNKTPARVRQALRDTAIGPIMRKCDECEAEEGKEKVPGIQPSLEVGPADDEYEREADEMADRVMRIPDPGGFYPHPKKAPQVQAKGTKGPGFTVPARVSKSINSLRGGGRPLPKSAKNYFEPRFGQDFSKVRLHTDGKAADTAAAIKARAFTLGNDIAFAKGAYQPDSDAGKRLLAHELTHTVQQGALHNVKRQEEQKSVPESTVGGSGVLLEIEGVVRELYLKIDQQIFKEAEYMLSKGAPEEVVAKWANEARNEAKAKVRNWSVLKRWAEERNIIKYGNKLGPNYEQLKYGDPKYNIKPRSDSEIIKSASKANKSVTKWAGRLRIAGRIMLGINLAIATYKVFSAPTEDRPKVLIKEATGFAGAAAGGWLGAKAGAWAGAGIGAWFAGVGAGPGAAVGAFLGGLGGAIGGAFLGAAAGDWLVNELYPVNETRFEEQQ